MHSKGTEASTNFKIKVKLLLWPSQANNPPGTSTQQIVRCVCWRACLAISAILVITNAGLSCQSHRGCISALRGIFFVFFQNKFLPAKNYQVAFHLLPVRLSSLGFPSIDNVSSNRLKLGPLLGHVGQLFVLSAQKLRKSNFLIFPSVQIYLFDTFLGAKTKARKYRSRVKTSKSYKTKLMSV